MTLVTFIPWTVNSESWSRMRLELRTNVFHRANLYLIPRILGPFNAFILLNGWICLHDVLD